jgi:hypothetical protein
MGAVVILESRHAPTLIATILVLGPTRIIHGRAWAELSDDVLESVETGGNAAIDAVRKFVDEVTPVLAGRQKRSTRRGSSFLRSVVRNAGQTLNKE